MISRIFKRSSWRAMMCLSLMLCIHLIGNAQPTANTPEMWSAQWIALPGNTGTEYGIYYFRKNIVMDAMPVSFKVHVSADNRYKLYVNEKLVSLGPARGDMYSWNYETVDLAPFLKAGKNTVSALVFNESEFRPVAQITFRTAFMLQGTERSSDMLKVALEEDHSLMYEYDETGDGVFSEVYTPDDDLFDDWKSLPDENIIESILGPETTKNAKIG